MNEFAEYGYAIGSMAGFVLVALAIAPMAAARKARDGIVSGAAPAPDYANPTYRLWRAHLNATEIMGVFVAATTSAMFAGVAPFWVNLLASLFLLSRIAHATVHIGGIGPAGFGPRTILFVFGWLMCVSLAVLAIVAVLSA